MEYRHFGMASHIVKGDTYRQYVRGVVTYKDGHEDVVVPSMHMGARVYYDPSATMPPGYYLSLARQCVIGLRNPLFGEVKEVLEEVAHGDYLCAVRAVTEEQLAGEGL